MVEPTGGVVGRAFRAGEQTVLASALANLRPIRWPALHGLSPQTNAFRHRIVLTVEDLFFISLLLFI